MVDVIPAIAEQLGGPRVRLARLCHFDFKSTPMRLWQGFGDLRAMGETWRGIGNLGAISATGSGMAGFAEEIRFRLAANDDVLTLADQDAANRETIGRDVRVWIAFFDDRPGSDWAILGDPFLYFWGPMGAPELVTEEADEDGNRQQFVELVATNAFALTARPPLATYSAIDVRARSSDGTDQIGDRMGEFLNGTVEWPRF